MTHTIWGTFSFPRRV